MSKEEMAWQLIMDNHVKQIGKDEWRVKSGDMSQIYSVVQWTKNDFQCTCKGFRSWKTECKHIGAVKRMIKIVEQSLR